VGTHFLTSRAAGSLECGDHLQHRPRERCWPIALHHPCGWQPVRCSI